jgi:hypothetical protein
LEVFEPFAKEVVEPSVVCGPRLSTVVVVQMEEQESWTSLAVSVQLEE